MSKLKIILRLYYEAKLSQRQIAKSLNLSVGAVNKYIKRAIRQGLTWPLPAEYEDHSALKQVMNLKSENSMTSAAALNFVEIHKEMQRKGVTLQLLWEEQTQAGQVTISYSQYCLLYRAWKKTRPLSMRQTHKAGDKVFIDYAGQTVTVLDPETGEAREAQIFIGVLGASCYSYVEATWSQQLPDWIGSHVRMFEFFGGVPALLVPDNLKSAITKACRYEPDTNQTYAECVEYYHTAVLPARPYKPKDKSKVEGAVLIVARWILARLRNRTFIGLAALNQAIQELVLFLNQRHFKKLPGSRRSAFLEVDQPALKPLPATAYEYAEFKKARAQIDYHVELEQHYYSVPYAFIGKEINLRYTDTMIECWYQGKQIAVHPRSYSRGQHTTVVMHMPTAHQQHLSWTPERFVLWATKIGPATTDLVKYLLEHKPHPEQGYRSCLGLLNLAKRFGDIRLEQACSYAAIAGLKTRRSIESILMRNLETTAINRDSINQNLPIALHDNVRGKQYYN